MKIQDDLINSIAKYIFAIFGLSKYKNNDIGVMKDEFKTSSEIKIQYDAGPIEKYSIYSASTVFENSKLHVAICSILDNKEYTDGAYYIALFKLDNFYTYALKLDLSFDEPTIFIVSKIAGNWSKLSMYEKIFACAGLEKLNDAGIVWKPEPIGDFYNQIVEVAEM